MNTDLPPVVTLESVDSTNRALADMVCSNRDLPAWTTISAEEQTAGRGRLDHRWQSPRGLNIACSILLRPTAPVGSLGTLPILAGLAVVHAVSKMDKETGDRLRIKWPNDVWCDGMKLCGILCEIPAVAGTPADGATPLIAGIGVNVNPGPDDIPPDLRRTATSLRIASSHEWNRQALLLHLREELARLYSTWSEIGVCPQPDGVCPQTIRGLSPFLDELRKRDLLLGGEITVESGNGVEGGVAAGIAGDGSLLLRKATGATIRVFAGDVHVRTFAARV